MAVHASRPIPELHSPAEVTNIAGLFSGVTGFPTGFPAGPAADFDGSAVTEFNDLFLSSDFNGPIRLDFGKARTVAQMLRTASSFDQPLHLELPVAVTMSGMIRPWVEFVAPWLIVRASLPLVRRAFRHHAESMASASVTFTMATLGPPSPSISNCRDLLSAVPVPVAQSGCRDRGAHLSYHAAHRCCSSR
jgi:hypothetical protein